MVAREPQYIAKYLEKLSHLPEDVKAILTAGTKRMHSRSKELPLGLPQEASRWNVFRGTREEVKRKITGRVVSAAAGGELEALEGCVVTPLSDPDPLQAVCHSELV